MNNQSIQHPDFNLKLERPICFLDVETTGIDVDKDRIVEISILKLFPDGTEELKSIRINPGFSIPKEATDIHGITDEFVKDCPRFEAYAKGIFHFIQGCDIVGFNSNRFDVPFVFYSLQRAGVEWDWHEINLVDVCGIFKVKEERSLSAAVKFYTGQDHQASHTAEGDVKATKEVFLQQLGRYSDLPKDFRELSRFSNWGNEIVDMAGKFTKDEDGDLIFTFGQHKDKKARTQPQYLQWMMKGDFPSDTKQFARSLIQQYYSTIKKWK
jgi:DNA polymerase-3 subunit epsilon